MRISGPHVSALVLWGLFGLSVGPTASAQASLPEDVVFMKSAHERALVLAKRQGDGSTLAELLSSRVLTIAAEIAAENNIDSQRYLKSDFRL